MKQLREEQSKIIDMLWNDCYTNVDSPEEMRRRLLILEKYVSSIYCQKPTPVDVIKRVKKKRKK